MPLFLDTCQLLPCWKIQVLILGIWRNTNISQNLSKFWVLLLSSGDPIECSASCAHLHFHEVMNWQRSDGGVFFYHWFPFIIHLSMRFEWYLIIICCSISISILIESVHYSQKSGMRTYTHEILVVIGTVIISAQLLETFVWTCFFG